MTALVLPMAPIAPSVPEAPATIVVDRSDAMRLLARVVIRAGSDHLTPRYQVPGVPFQHLLWVHAGQVEDIAGQVLAAAGVPVERLAECEGFTVAEALERGLPSWPLTVTPGAIAVLMAAQDAQDIGWSWGDALRLAVVACATARARGQQ